MTALKAHEVQRFLKAPDLKAGLYLVYGSDAGLIRETAQRLIRFYAGETPDPMAHTTLDAQMLSDDPARLAVEARTSSLFGGARTLRLRGATKALTATFTELLEDMPEAIIVAEAGNLQKSDSLRLLAEKSKFAKALPCFADNERSLEELIRSTLTGAGIQYSADVPSALKANLGNDREVTRRELEKLVLYAGDDKRLSAEDVALVCGDNSAQAMDAIIDAVGTGHARQFDTAFQSALASGIDVQRLLAIAQIHFANLRRWRQSVSSGTPAKAVLDGLRPRPHFSRRPALEQQLRLWSDTSLAQASARIATAILDTRKNYAMAPAIAQRALLAICISAAQR